MKEIWNKHKRKIFLWAIILLLVVPTAINTLFKLHPTCNFFVAEWDAGDVLTFYGAMLASIATIIGVYFSIEYAQRNYRKDEANKVKPYFALTHYKAHSRSNLIEGFPECTVDTDRAEQPKSYYEEYKLQEVYIIVDQLGIDFRDKLTDTQLERLKSGGLQWNKISESCEVLQFHEFVSMPFEVENVGSGAATNTLISFYKKGDDWRGVSLFTTEEGDSFYIKGDDIRAVNLYTIKQGNSFYFHILCDDANIVEGNDYIIELRYGDIIGNNYSQKYPVKFKKDAKTKRFCTTVCLSGTQEIADNSTEEE